MAVPAAVFAAGTKAGGFDARWRRHAAILAGVAILLVLLFHEDAAGLAKIWWTSTTFGHCLFIAPVIAWLVWNRRAELGQVVPIAWWPGLALVALGGFGWLLGDAASVALARHLGLVMMLQGAVVTILGPNVARALLFPLCYAFFLVPFGEGLEGPLQTFTVGMTMPLLHLFGVPAQVDGVLITIPNGYFEVAEACSGAKFVIAMIAYGALVANVCFTSWTRRAIFMVVALVVPVVANGLRAFGTIYAAHLTSVERATGMDHIVYGWIFFGVVMAAVIAMGWRWFDRAPDAPVFDPATLQAEPKRRIDVLIAAALVLTVAGAFTAWSAAIAGRAQILPTAISLPDVPGWRRAPMSVRAPWSPYYPGADHYLIGRYDNGSGDVVDLAIAVYGSQHEGKELVSFGTGAIREDDIWVRIEDLPDLAGGAAMRVTAPGPVERQIVTWYRVGDALTHSDKRVKLETLEAKLLGGPQRAVAVHVSAEVLPGRNPRAAMERFVQALGPIDRVADRSAGLP
ncbi:MAG: exosortase [Sphingomonas bacterium]|uniref:exosortase A n=1 Tax=Sphingomonas bacterium TaxID=1895847 RepID=UPI00261E0D46|nr:exosortase A [Sphingomonas bacterium]MDB5705051.1 exosortase [Sphingomonas bacterium]